MHRTLQPTDWTRAIDGSECSAISRKKCNVHTSKVHNSKAKIGLHFSTKNVHVSKDMILVFTAFKSLLKNLGHMRKYKCRDILSNTVNCINTEGESIGILIQYLTSNICNLNFIL